MDENKIYIVAAKRSPIGSFLGSLAIVSLVDLAVQTVSQTLEAHKLNPIWFDHLILGNVLSAGNGQGPARQIAIKSGLSQQTPAYGLNMICGSGLKAVISAYALITAKINNLICVVGAESMSTAPFLVPGKVRIGHKMGDMNLIDSLINDSLTDAFDKIHMGVTAENIVNKFHLSREEQDRFAWHSHHKAITAINTNKFQNEIVPITIKTKKGEITFSSDESPRANLAIEQLSKLKPVFQTEHGTVTAGNSSSINDGAACVVVASAQAVKQHNLQPLVEIVAIGQDGIDPTIMGLGPVGAVHQALEKANLKLAQIDVLELNEAFASQSLGVIKSLATAHNLTEEAILAKTNLNGGAIALGHPVGCSGTRILVTLIHLLKARKQKYGLATLCIGGGMGICLIVKNLLGEWNA